MTFDFLTEVLPAVKARAAAVLKRTHDRDDAISVAWELWRMKPDAPPPSLAYYACKRVRCDRQFSESIASVTGPASRRCEKPERISLMEVLRETDDPRDLVAVRLDYAAWLQTLTPRERELLEAFLLRERTKDLARRFRVTAARISQIRRELLEFWQAFTA
jgi:hypothetical protein